MSQLSIICSADLVTQAFGCPNYTGEWPRSDCAGGYFHAGIDLGWSNGGNNHLGEPVYALKAGTVVAIGPIYPATGAQYLGPYAPCIQEPAAGKDGSAIWEYGHVQDVYVNVGDEVEAGQPIAAVGTLGGSTAGHVHVEKRLDAPIQGLDWGTDYPAPSWTAIVDPTQEVLDVSDFMQRLSNLEAAVGLGERGWNPPSPDITISSRSATCWAPWEPPNRAGTRPARISRWQSRSATCWAPSGPASMDGRAPRPCRTGSGSWPPRWPRCWRAAPRPRTCVEARWGWA
jgi:hypothetical protein